MSALAVSPVTVVSGLDARVLVLNRSYQAVAVTRAGRAFGLLCSGAARALDGQFRTFDFASWSELAAQAGDDVVRTSSQVLKVPRVLVLQAYDRMPRTQVRFSRQNIYMRDGFVCQYCGKSFARSHLNLDHVVPRAHGGRTSWDNVVCSCVRCNLHKGGRTPAQANMRLLREPRKPTWSSLTPAVSKVPYAEWLPFVDPATAAYWNTELVDDDSTGS
jgi:5-methylcytosine-specific restriction endonuclease McrA